MVLIEPADLFSVAASRAVVVEIAEEGEQTTADLSLAHIPIKLIRQKNHSI
jgi:hypothetical protein